MSIGYVLLGIPWFFALGFGAGVGWTVRKYRKAPRPVPQHPVEVPGGRLLVPGVFARPGRHDD